MYHLLHLQEFRRIFFLYQNWRRDILSVIWSSSWKKHFDLLIKFTTKFISHGYIVIQDMSCKYVYALSLMISQRMTWWYFKEQSSPRIYRNQTSKLVSGKLHDPRVKIQYGDCQSTNIAKLFAHSSVNETSWRLIYSYILKKTYDIM